MHWFNEQAQTFMPLWDRPPPLAPTVAAAAGACRLHWDCRCSSMSLSPALRPLLQQLTSLRGFLPACSSSLLGSRGFAAAGSGSGRSGGGSSGRNQWDDEWTAVNPKYRCVCCPFTEPVSTAVSITADSASTVLFVLPCPCLAWLAPCCVSNVDVPLLPSQVGNRDGVASHPAAGAL